MGKEQVDEALGGGLRFVIGQADPLIGFDDHVIRVLGIAHHQVQAYHGDVQGARGTHRRIGQYGVQAFGHVFERATGVQIGGAAHGKALPCRQHTVVAQP